MPFTGRYFLRILSVALVSVLTLLVAACSGDSGPAGAGSIVIAVEEVPPMIQDPMRDIRASGGIGKDLSVYETIVRAPHVAPPAPPPLDHTGYSPADKGIAESWEISSDFTSITFKIRPDIPWHENG